MRQQILMLMIVLMAGPLVAGEEISLAGYQQHLRAANGAAQQGQFQTALNHFLALMEMVPHNPAVYYAAAAMHARLGQADNALTCLEKALVLGHDVNGRLDPAFDGLREAESFKTIEALLKKQDTPVGHSQLAFTLSEKDLLPEGITHDPVSGCFYLGSLWKSKIVRISPDGQVSDFTTERQDGLRSMAGLAVDAPRRVLWALSFVSPPWPVPAPGERGWSGLFKYDLETGKLVGKYVLQESGVPHLFNDLAVSKAGDVFLTDSLAGAVYVLRHDRDELEVFLASPAFMFPNGITLGPDEMTLYVTSGGAGVYRIDIQSKKYALLAQPDDISLCRIDGMYVHRDSLVCMQNGLNRISRFYLNPAGDTVERLEIVETRNPHFILPTTGVFVGDWFYYIANSQAYCINRDGTLFPPEQLKDVVILKTELK